MDARNRQGLGDRRVLDAAAGDRGTHTARGVEGQAQRTNAGDPAPHRALAPGGERTIVVDCDVLVADAGTRCASITAGYIALALAVRRLEQEGVAKAGVLVDSVSAVSVGVVGGAPVLDLTYEEDAHAEVDCNVVMTGSGALVEVQGTAEGEPFSREELNALLDLAESGISQLTKVQRISA